MPPDDLYRSLQRHLDRGPVGFPATESGVEIRILKAIFTPEEAELALALSAFPEPARVIHKRLKNKMSLPDLVTALDGMADRGSVLGIPIGAERRYAKRIFVIGFFESQVRRLTAELADDADKYFEEAFGSAFHTGKTTQMRVVPVSKSIPAPRHVAPSQDIRAYVEASPGPFAAMTCICRHAKDLRADPCKQTALRENCLMIGVAATHMTERGPARLISREEMLGLLDAADREGLVLQPENTKNPLFVCCCCGCCCGVLRSAKRLPNPAEFFSAEFYAEVNEDLCESCGTCETRCQMDAIRTGEAKPSVDRSRCIGCGLCLTTCPSGAMRLEPNPRPKPMPENTGALYRQLLQDRYGALGTARLAAMHVLHRKI